MKYTLSALIISQSNKGIDVIFDILYSFGYTNIDTTQNCILAKNLTQSNSYDLIIINSNDNEKSELFAINSTSKPLSQILMIVKEDLIDYISNVVEDYGIITISKPINKELLTSLLKIFKSTSIKMKKLFAEKEKLSAQLDDIKFVDKAKFILITHLNMSETQAHKYIEKESMNTRTSKRIVAEKILKTYDW